MLLKPNTQISSTTNKLHLTNTEPPPPPPYKIYTYRSKQAIGTGAAIHTPTSVFHIQTAFHAFCYDSRSSINSKSTCPHAPILPPPLCKPTNSHRFIICTSRTYTIPSTRTVCTLQTKSDNTSPVYKVKIPTSYPFGYPVTLTSRATK